MINHRVNIHSSIDDVKQHVVSTLKPVAKEFDLAIAGWGDYTPKGGVRGTVYLSDAYEIPHGPAPITPTGLDSAAWRVFAGTSRGMWASRAEVSEDGRVMQLEEDDELVMAPFMGTGVGRLGYCEAVGNRADRCCLSPEYRYKTVSRLLFLLNPFPSLEFSATSRFSFPPSTPKIVG